MKPALFIMYVIVTVILVLFMENIGKIAKAMLFVMKHSWKLLLAALIVSILLLLMKGIV